MTDAVSDAAWLAAMLEVESALAAAQASVGLIPVEDAAAIAAACDPARFDIDAIGRDAAGSANPVVPLVKALREAVPAGSRGSVHLGATSQDVLDTSMMLLTRRALDLLLADLEALVHACAHLAREHRRTAMAGRTLLQQAVPISFGLKAAVWMTAVDEAADGLIAYRRDRLAIQLGGAAGTLAALGDSALLVSAALARGLDLDEPALPWHADRGRVAQLGAALAVAAGAAGKVALDILLLSQTEVGEVTEGASGGSSAMPHKRNPVAAIEADACVRGVLAQAALLLGSQRAEHERAAGAWQAEWPAVSEAFRLTAGAVARTRASVEGLEVDAARMRANLELGGGFGRDRTPLEQLGKAEELIDRALAAHRKRRHQR